MPVDGFLGSINFETPPETGLLNVKADGVCSWIIWDCKLELNFVPPLITET